MKHCVYTEKEKEREVWLFGNTEKKESVIGKGTKREERGKPL